MEAENAAEVEKLGMDRELLIEAQRRGLLTLDYDEKSGGYTVKAVDE